MSDSNENKKIRRKPWERKSKLTETASSDFKLNNSSFDEPPESTAFSEVDTESEKPATDFFASFQETIATAASSDEEIANMIALFDTQIYDGSSSVSAAAATAPSPSIIKVVAPSLVFSPTSAPSGFKSQQMSMTDMPPPTHPTTLKHQIYSDPDFFTEVDDHAIAVAKVSYTNFQDLMWNLIYKKDFNQLQKARAIFRWMTRKSTLTYVFESEDPDSADSILQRFRERTTSYARVLECLALHAGLHCVVLSGWAKGSDYQLGSSVPITSGPTNHSWNAIYIDGSWQFVDCKWANRMYRKNRSEQGTQGTNKNDGDFYFIPDPEQFIYSHFPEDPIWQLCYPTRSKVEFDDYPYTKSNFFTTGMQFLRQNQGTIYTHKGILVLTLGLTKSADFIFKLKYADKSTDDFEGVPLKRFVLQEITENRVSFFVRAPEEGTYYLIIYGKIVQQNNKMQDAYDEVCTYKVIGDKAAAAVIPYPECANSSYGPGVRLKRFGLTSSYQRAIVGTSNRCVELVFKKLCPVTLEAHLINNDLNDQELLNVVTVLEQNDDVNVTCRLSAEGEFGLAIHASTSGSNIEINKSTYICQYLLSYTNQDLQTLYGHVYDQNNYEEFVRYNYSPDLYRDLAGDEPPEPSDAGLLINFSDDNRTPENVRTTDLLEPNLPKPLTEPLRLLESSAPEPSCGQSAETSATSATRTMCRICLEDETQIRSERRSIMSTTCGHIFCETCLKTILKLQKGCPTCRHPLTSKDVHPIYL